MRTQHPLCPSAIAAALLAAAGLLTPASAHHGQDFLIVQDHAVPAPGSGYLLGSFEWEKYPDHNEYGLGPGLMFGILPQVALGLDVHFRDEGDGWDFSNVAPMVHLQLTPPDSKFPIKFGIAAGYQFGNGGGAEETHDHADEHDHGDHHGEEHAHEEGHAHSHGGSIHNHDDDLFVGRFIAESDFGDTKVVLNLIALAGDGRAAWGYAAGVRHKVMDQLSLGVEAMGDFDSDGWQEIVGGAYFEPIHSLTLKLGVGFGLTEESPDLSLRTGFIWRF